MSEDISNRRKFTLGVGITLFTLLMIVSFWYLFNKPDKDTSPTETEKIDTPNSQDDFSASTQKEDSKGSVLIPRDSENPEVEKVRDLVQAEYHPFAKTDDWDKAYEALEKLETDDSTKKALTNALAEKYRTYELAKIDEIARRDGTKVALNYIEGQLVYGEPNKRIKDQWYFKEYPKENSQLVKINQKIATKTASNKADTGKTPKAIQTATILSDFSSASEPIEDENGELYFYSQLVLDVEEFLLEVLNRPYDRHDYHSMYQKIHVDYEWANSKDAAKLEEFQLVLLRNQIEAIKKQTAQKINFAAVSNENELESREKGKFDFYGSNSSALCEIVDVRDEVWSLLSETNQIIFDDELLSIKQQYDAYLSNANLVFYIRLTEKLTVGQLAKRLGAEEIHLFKKSGDNWTDTSGNLSLNETYKVNVVSRNDASQLCSQ